MKENIHLIDFNGRRTLVSQCDRAVPVVGHQGDESQKQDNYNQNDREYQNEWVQICKEENQVSYSIKMLYFLIIFIGRT